MTLLPIFQLHSLFFPIHSSLFCDQLLYLLKWKHRPDFRVEPGQGCDWLPWKRRQKDTFLSWSQLHFSRGATLWVPLLESLPSTTPCPAESFCSPFFSLVGNSIPVTVTKNNKNSIIKKKLYGEDQSAKLNSIWSV